MRNGRRNYGELFMSTKDQWPQSAYLWIRLYALITVTVTERCVAISMLMYSSMNHFACVYRCDFCIIFHCMMMMMMMMIMMMMMMMMMVMVMMMVMIDDDHGSDDDDGDDDDCM